MNGADGRANASGDLAEQGEAEGERGADVGAAPDLDAAAVGFDDGFADGKAEASVAGGA